VNIEEARLIAAGGPVELRRRVNQVLSFEGAEGAVIEVVGMGPFGQPGTRLAVLEPWRIESMPDGDPIIFGYLSDRSTIDEPDWACGESGYFDWYKAQAERVVFECIALGLEYGEDGYFHWPSGACPLKWLRASEMPSWASRFTLVTKSVRVDRSGARPEWVATLDLVEVPSV
jgi:hypothetical protein